MVSILPKKIPKIGLALSGGSALGNVHIGVIQAMIDHKIPISCISGTSAGAVVAACFAFGMTPKDMAERAKNLSWYELTNFSHSLKGLASSQAVGKIMEEMLGKVNIEKSQIPLAILATDIETGREVVFKKGSLAQAVMASVCIPGLFSPVEIHGQQLVDGGLVKNLPLSSLNELGAEFKIGVNLSRWRSYKKPKNILDVMLNSLDIMTHNQTNQDAKTADLIIEPRLEDYSTSDFKKSEELIAIGYRAATLALAELPERLALAAGQTKPGWWQKFINLFTNS